jgi:hypothetical protein
MRLPRSPIGSAALVLLAGPGNGAPPAVPDWTSTAAQLAAYPLRGCIVCEADLAQGATNFLHGERLVRACSPECWDTFAASPAWYVERIDEALFGQQRARYPLATCAACGRALDVTGEPVDLIRGARLVRLCGQECVVRFWKDPGPAMAAVDSAWIAAQRPSYPTQICPVMDLEVDAMDTPVEILHGTRLVRLCCESCAETFREDPAPWLANLDKLASAATPGKRP